MRNIYFSDAVRSEQKLYESIVIESLKMYGQDVYYLPRDIVSEDTILGDDITSSFNSAYKVEMYIENIDGFDGEGDLFTKFGVQIRDAATFVVARLRWSSTVGRRDNDINSIRPREGDLIYLPLSNSLFEIMHVEHEQPFYQLSNLPVYKLRCELFEYSSEAFSTSVADIDSIQELYDYIYRLSFTQTTATVSAVLTNNTISSYNITNAGVGYVNIPTVTLSGLPEINAQKKFGTNSLFPATADVNGLTSYSKTIDEADQSYTGTLDFFVFINSLPSENEFMGLGYWGKPTSAELINYEYHVAVNTNGQIVGYNDSIGTIETFENIGGANKLTTGTWHHVSYSIRGAASGSSPRTLQIYIDGELVYRQNSVNYGGLFGDTVVMGGTDAFDTFVYGPLDGYIDDVLANTTNPNLVDIITVPSSARSGNASNDIFVLNFDTPTTTATATLSSGTVDSITTSNNHSFFAVAPTVTISAPVALEFTEGGSVTQTLSSGVVVTGEVVKWNSTTRELDVARVGASDGEYHSFVTTRNVTDVATGIETIAPSSVEELNRLSSNEDNSEFTTVTDFIDFSETNPFGDPS